MRISFLSSPKAETQRAVQRLRDEYGHCQLADADYVVAVGGDGMVLKALHSVISDMNKPVFSMRSEGSVGFLGNAFNTANLHKRIKSATAVSLHPLRADAITDQGQKIVAYAINEISLVRQTRQSAKLRLTMNGIERIPLFVGDGVLVSTPIGSTAYNRSAGGPMLPLDSQLLAITGLAISPASRWSNAVVRDTAIVEFEVLEEEHRPVKLETDISEQPNVTRITIAKSDEHRLTLLFDSDANLDSDRVIGWSNKSWAKG